MTMTEIVDEVVRLADRRRAAVDAREADADLFTRRTPGRPALRDPAAAELEAYLGALPEFDARRLHTLMYYGRGDDELLSLEAHFAANRDSIDWVRYAMFEK